MRVTTLMSTLTAVVLLSSAALAQEPMDGPPKPGVHRHDGFYLRIATGFGTHTETLYLDGDRLSEESGMASVGEVAIGGAIRPGVILGGGIYSSTLLETRGEMSTDEERRTDFVIVGPFVDYYTNASRGFHVQLAMGPATIRGFNPMGGNLDSEDDASLGVGFMCGLGYDWWVSDQWSFGVLARLTAAVATDEETDGTLWEHGGATPALLFTATYN